MFSTFRVSELIKDNQSLSEQVDSLGQYVTQNSSNEKMVFLQHTLGTMEEKYAKEKVYFRKELARYKQEIIKLIQEVFLL